MEPEQLLALEARLRAIHAPHAPHAPGSRECSNRCETAHWGVQVCNEDARLWPCPTLRALDGED